MRSLMHPMEPLQLASTTGQCISGNLARLLRLSLWLGACAFSRSPSALIVGCWPSVAMGGSLSTATEARTRASFILRFLERCAHSASAQMDEHFGWVTTPVWPNPL